jgi:hypothetical protein
MQGFCIFLIKYSTIQIYAQKVDCQGKNDSQNSLVMFEIVCKFSGLTKYVPFQQFLSQQQLGF